ncbi:MAG: hypothetical protein LBQ40_00705 [Clostridiales bacterium]|jgi:hypothetical protein|nr:hypothetical protein [Clostridiales bacterium]
MDEKTFIIVMSTLCVIGLADLIVMYWLWHKNIKTDKPFNLLQHILPIPFGKSKYASNSGIFKKVFIPVIIMLAIVSAIETVFVLYFRIYENREIMIGLIIANCVIALFFTVGFVALKNVLKNRNTD